MTDLLQVENLSVGELPALTRVHPIPYLPSALPVGWDDGLSQAEFDKLRSFLGEHMLGDGMQAHFAQAAFSSLEGLEELLHFHGPAVWRPKLW